MLKSQSFSIKQTTIVVAIIVDKLINVYKKYYAIFNCFNDN